MSFDLQGNQTSLSFAADEITLVIIVLSICLAWVITARIKYRHYAK